MYIIYLDCEPYGVTTSKEKAWEILADYLKKEGITEDFLENAKKDFYIYDDYYKGDNWISFTDNIF